MTTNELIAFYVKGAKWADILFDLHQCIGHQLWLDRPESEKSTITVDASAAMRVGSEPLAIISKIK